LQKNSKRKKLYHLFSKITPLLIALSTKIQNINRIKSKTRLINTFPRYLTRLATLAAKYKAHLMEPEVIIALRDWVVEVLSRKSNNKEYHIKQRKLIYKKDTHTNINSTF
jgi:hypothetical protein